MTQEKIDKLESIGFKFFIGKGKAIRHWDQFFVDLILFKEKFGKTKECSDFSFFLGVANILTRLSCNNRAYKYTT